MEISNISSANLSLQRLDPVQKRAQLFTQTDADGSGTITKQELTDALSNRPKPPGGGEAPDVDDLLTLMDTDGSGDVSEAEHTTFLESQDAARGSQPPPPSQGRFDGSTSILSSLLAALESAEGDEGDTDVQGLLTKLVESLKERDSSYRADGTETSAAAQNLFETEA